VRYFARFNPFRAIADLRLFLSHRQPHELWFGILAIFLTGLILVGFVKDSHVPRPYKSNITYVESWPLSRTDKEIIAQQKIDQVAREKREAEIRAAQERTRAQFKRIDDKLKAYGL
jgi:hypothetical protein